MTIALKNQLNCPRTSSVGRLFDAFSSLLGLCHQNNYEGQGAMLLENCAILTEHIPPYPYQIYQKKPAIIDWESLLVSFLADRLHHSTAYCATRLHNTFADICINIAQVLNEKTIVLSGGCFQNATLTQRVFKQLSAAGFDVFCHAQVPPNDGGLALGQLYAGYFIQEAQDPRQ